MNSRRTTAASCAAFLAIVLAGAAHAAHQSDLASSKPVEAAADLAQAFDPPCLASFEIGSSQSPATPHAILAGEPRASALMGLAALLFWISRRKFVS